MYYRCLRQLQKYISVQIFQTAADMRSDKSLGYHHISLRTEGFIERKATTLDRLRRYANAYLSLGVTSSKC